MLHETKGLNMLKTVNCTEYLKNKLSIKSIFSWLNGRAVEQLNSSISVKFFNLSTIKLKNLFTTHYSKFTKKLFAFTLAETLIGRNTNCNGCNRCCCSTNLTELKSVNQ